MLLLRTPPLKDTWECPSLDWLPGPEPVAQQESPLLLLQGAVWRGWPTPAPTMGAWTGPSHSLRLRGRLLKPQELRPAVRCLSGHQTPTAEAAASSSPSEAATPFTHRPLGRGPWAVGCTGPRGGKGQAGDDLRSPRCCGGGRPFFLALFPHRRVGVAIVPPVQKLCEDTANPVNGPAD